MLIPEHVVLG